MKLLLPVSGVNVELVLIVALIGLRYCAEYSETFAPCDYSHIIVLILFELAASETLDSAGSSSGLCRCGKVPVPFSVRVGGHENIISAGSVNGVPVEFNIRALGTGQLGGHILGPGCNDDRVGPGAVAGDLSSAVGLNRTYIGNIDVLVVQVVDPDTVVTGADVTAHIMRAVSPDTFDLISSSAGDALPGDRCR